jgi:hypothetical protein
VIEVSAASRNMQADSASFRWHIRVESWYNGVLLHDDVPLTDATETSDRTSTVPERLSMTVPREVDGFNWSPETDELHPLAPYGQRLRVILGVEVARATVEWVQRGEYLITRATPQGDEVRVEALGLLALVEEARLVSPYQPSGTLKSTLRGLIEPALTVVFDAALTDRAVPAGVNYDEDRLGAVRELLAAWPAEARMTGDGYLAVFPSVVPTEAQSVLILLDDYIDYQGDVTRDGVFNAVVARGTASDGAQVQGVAYNYDGPHRIGGPFNALPVPEYLASPLLTTVAQCRAAAQTRLARIKREQRRPIKVTSPPVTFLQIADVVRAAKTSADVLMLCTVEAITLPLVPGSDQPMELTLAGDPDA